MQTACGDLEILCRPDVSRLHAERHRLRAELFDQALSILVICIDDRAIRTLNLKEQRPLRRKVIFKVLVKIEMFVREVREHRGSESNSIRALQRERMRGNFHHCVLHAGFDHLGEPLLQHDRIRRGPIGDELLIAGAMLDRADEAHGLVRRIED